MKQTKDKLLNMRRSCLVAKEKGMLDLVRKKALLCHWNNKRGKVQVKYRLCWDWLSFSARFTDLIKYSLNYAKM